ncbi:sortase domain-bontaining protein [Streptomyces sp. NPDC058375]|uniref:sortase domain-containing protein n=1 Tax=Streptomyces sp. NPDC058375 TaxID=3346467 RepID=UPI003664FEF5
MSVRLVVRTFSELCVTVGALIILFVVRGRGRDRHPPEPVGPRTRGPGPGRGFAGAGELRPGDAVVVNDGTTWFTYRIAKKPYRTVPTDTAVVDPVPRGSGFEGSGRYLTLTTCEPEWGSSHRLIVWAHLDATRPVSDGRPPELAG